MSSPGEEGGTRIQKRPQAQPQFNQPPPMQPPPEQMYQQPPQQMYQQPPQQMYQQPPQQHQAQLNIPKLKTASRFSNVDFDSITFKYSVIVACIFILLNSKIIWNQIIRFPFMGGVEPSILALIINSILAAVIFYVVSKQF
jgi:hypothetical protein